MDEESQSSASQISQTTTADEAPDVETAAQQDDYSHEDQPPSEIAISKIDADFRLGKFSLTLLYDHVERDGIEICMREFAINFKKYDSDQVRSRFAHELHARNETFGIYSVSANKAKVAILE